MSSQLTEPCYRPSTSLEDVSYQQFSIPGWFRGSVETYQRFCLILVKTVCVSGLPVKTVFLVETVLVLCRLVQTVLLV